MKPDAFDRSRLSVREDAILGHAIEGMTDQQIALRLSITVSTVNSYWVRIRGKLGQLSRTELVALALKQKAHSEMDVAQAQIAELREAALRHTTMSADFANAEIYRAALDAMPEATLIACKDALIRYANARLETMFGYAEGELVERPVSILVPTQLRESEGAKMAAYIKGPHPLHLGTGSVVYGQRKNGSQFRITLAIDSRPTSNGPVFSCVVRDFTQDVENRRRQISTWRSV